MHYFWTQIRFFSLFFLWVWGSLNTFARLFKEKKREITDNLFPPKTNL